MCDLTGTALKKLYEQFSHVKVISVLTCDECKEVIPNNEPLTAVDGKVYHLKCFAMPKNEVK